ncbi:MAG: A/G-specific adenine glycosylase [Candidatus Pelethousia sp.]|nr:A/G-specific adenine glycosylase [Candidatus Pelethousia sp.]
MSNHSSFEVPSFPHLDLLPEALLPWYREHARDLPWRADRDPYHVWISEIMLQQTRAEAVRGYYYRFLSEFPSISALAGAEETRLLKLWEGLGYYNRVRNLHKAAKLILVDYGGVFPRQYEQVRTLPGIGDYTAGAICSICFEMPIAAVDGNVLRCISRIGEIDRPMDAPPMKRAVAAALCAIYPPGQCGDFTQSLMELGATVCLAGAKPRCESCPAKGFCGAHASGRQAMFPKLSPKRRRKVENRTVFLLEWEGKLALCRRPSTGLLAGLWQFPNVLGSLSAQEALAQAFAWGLSPIAPEQALCRSHVFTHLEWRMTAYRIRCGQPSSAFIWAAPLELRQIYALPTAFRQFL